MKEFWKDKKVLITGASGFVGSNAIDLLLKLGANITALVSPYASKDKLIQKIGVNINKIKLLQIDLLNLKEVIKSFKGIEIALNFAAVDGGREFKLRHSSRIFSQNIVILLNVLESSIKSNVKVFLLISSADIYSDKVGDLTEKDYSRINLKHSLDGYRLTKLLSEKIANIFSRQYGINIVIVRPANLYGPKDNFDNITKIRFIPSVIRRIFLDRKPVVMWGSGNEIRSFLYIDDFLKVCCKLIEYNVFNKPINVASKEYIKLKDLTKKIINLTGKEIKITIDSSKSAGNKIRKFDLSLLENKIGQTRETSLNKGLKKTISYFKQFYIDV